MFAWLVLRYTTIGPHGISVHSNLKTQTVAWPELAEVRWHRMVLADIGRAWAVHTD